jgi:hypothetical protein
MFDINSNWNVFRGMTIATMSIAIAGLGLAPNLAASDADHKTIVTFNTPVEIPGKALPAGTYVFKLLNSTSNRNIVQIFDKDEKQLLATILAVPDYRMQPSDKPIIMFEERAPGTPQAIKAWFYPGDSYGQAFVYPHKQAVELAKRTKQNVPSMSDDMSQNMKTQSTSADDAGVQALQNTDVTGVGPTGKAVELVIIVGAPAK